MLVSKSLNLNDSRQGKHLSHYLIANNTPEMLANLYCHSDSADIRPLYLDSDFSHFLDISPYITKVEIGDTLLNLFVNSTETGNSWSGVIVSTSSTLTFEALILHLQERLMTTFSEGRKGVMHYYNPVVADYFIGESNYDDTARWLGPIVQFTWRNQTLSPRFNLWCSVESPQSNKDKSTTTQSPWVLTSSQEKALEQLYDDKILASYFKNNIQLKLTPDIWKQYREYFKRSEEMGLVDKQYIFEFFKIIERNGLPHREKTLYTKLVSTKNQEDKLKIYKHALQREELYVS
ncbi:DUF4123 domain-containing protein [Enterovibrio calviensis]|uniref:DUF4123 domain-containing protein n=1 Tax=Enterovibrio calviensis TaxID=91359 RepID=UPI000483FB3D|nr:DUF4123 domain-containing protein [Enterovibrio calviensis]